MRSARNNSRSSGCSRSWCRATGESRQVDLLRHCSGASPYRSTQRVRPSSTAMSTKLLRVKRHHASSSGPMLGSPLITATRSPLRLRRSAAIKSGRRPEANVLVPASSSTFALVLMNKSTVLQTFQAYRTSFAPETISPERNEQDQSPTKMQQNQRFASFILPLITVWLQVRSPDRPTNEIRHFCGRKVKRMTIPTATLRCRSGCWHRHDR